MILFPKADFHIYKIRLEKIIYLRALTEGDGATWTIWATVRSLYSVCYVCCQLAIFGNGRQKALFAPCLAQSHSSHNIISPISQFSFKVKSGQILQGPHCSDEVSEIIKVPFNRISLFSRPVLFNSYADGWSLWRPGSSNRYCRKLIFFKKRQKKHRAFCKDNLNVFRQV